MASELKKKIKFKNQNNEFLPNVTFLATTPLFILEIDKMLIGKSNKFCKAI
jgi:hypothetical protein